MNQPAQSLLAGRHRFRNVAIDNNVSIKSGLGVLHTLTVNAGGVTSTVAVYDNTAASGTLIGTFDTSAPRTFLLDATFNTGLAVLTSSGGGAADITLTYT